MRTELRTDLRYAATGVTMVCAWLLFAVGLVSPLTPSEGVPSASDLLLFIGAPVGMLFTCAKYASERSLRWFLVAQQVAIVVVAAALLLLLF